MRRLVQYAAARLTPRAPSHCHDEHAPQERQQHRARPAVREQGQRQSGEKMGRSQSVIPLCRTRFLTRRVIEVVVGRRRRRAAAPTHSASRRPLCHMVAAPGTWFPPARGSHTRRWISGVSVALLQATDCEGEGEGQCPLFPPLLSTRAQPRSGPCARRPYAWRLATRPGNRGARAGRMDCLLNRIQPTEN